MSTAAESVDEIKKKKKAADEEKIGLYPPSAYRCVVPTMVAMLCV